jgi:hypothetical protein
MEGEAWGGALVHVECYAWPCRCLPISGTLMLGAKLMYAYHPVCKISSNNLQI